jgi:phosphatidylinositol glycan class B
VEKIKTLYRKSEDVLKRRSALIAFGSVIFLAAVLRDVTAFLFPNIAHTDEIFQIQEQAHRVVFGLGITPWEFLIGMRSWIFPGLLTGIAEICRVLGGGSESFVVAVKLFMIAISIIPVCCGWRWAIDCSG